MRAGKINTFPRPEDINSLLSNVPIPDNSNYTTVFKSAITGYYYERLSTGQINKITCCKNEVSFVVNVSQVGLAPMTAVPIVTDIVPSGSAYVGVGVYNIAFAGAPFAGVVAVDIAQPSPAVGFARAIVLNPQVIQVQTFDNTFAPSDNILSGQTLRVTT